MKIKMAFLFGFFAILAFGSMAVNAGGKNQALTACKAHITNLYKDDLRRMKLKKTRKRKGSTEIHMKVMSKDATFRAVCKISTDGGLSYSTNRDSM